jgi:hypothetical protein
MPARLKGAEIPDLSKVLRASSLSIFDGSARRLIEGVRVSIFDESAESTDFRPPRIEGAHPLC